MRVRVKFAKYGPMKFIGHLELMRYLQSAVRRTEIPVKYDEGMHQRMIMSFAMPLGVGPTSSAEYMDIELEEPISTEEAMRELAKQGTLTEVVPELVQTVLEALLSRAMGPLRSGFWTGQSSG